MLDGGKGKPCHSQCVCWAFSRLGIAGNGPSPRIHPGEKPFCNRSASGASAASLCSGAGCGLGSGRGAAAAAGLAAGHLPGWGRMCQRVPYGQRPGQKHRLRELEGARQGQQPCRGPQPAEPVLLSQQHKGKPLLEAWGLPPAPLSAGSSLQNRLILLSVPKGLKGSCPIR